MRIGLAAIGGGAALAELSVIASLPAFQIGAYVDSEPAGVAFLLAGALCLFGLAAMLPRYRLARAALCHPLFLLALALGLWSALVSPLVEFPLLSILGPPQSSQGALWFVAMAAFFAAFLVLGRLPRARRFHLMLLSAAALLAAILHLPQAPLVAPYVAGWLDAGVAPFAFNKYLAYYSFPLLALAAALWRRDRGPSAVALLAGVVTLLASSNLTAGLIVLVVAPLSAIVLAAGRRSPERTRLWTSLAAACVIIGALSYPMVRQAPPGGELKTIWSRGILGRAIEPTLVQPMTWIAGKGWGHYFQEMQRNLGTTDIRLFKSEWDEINRDEFHSHNAGLEALFSAGIVGAVLALLWPAALIRTAQPRHRAMAAGLALSLAMLDALWFQLPVTVAAGAMGAGFLTRRGRSRRLPLAPASAAGMAVLGLVLSAASLVVWRHAWQVEAWKACLQIHTPAVPVGCMGIPWDPRQSRAGEAVVLHEILAERDARVTPATSFLRQTVANGTEILPHSGLSFALALHNAYSLWSLHAPLSAGESAKWDAVVSQMQSAAPRRPDVIIPYVNWLIGSKREIGAGIVVARSAVGWPDHPVVLWYRGVLMLADPAATQQGLALMRQALAGGIERFQPVPPEVRAALSQ